MLGMNPEVSGKPADKTKSFKVDRIDIPYTLKIINGSFDGSHRVSSAEIQLNGKLIARPNQFN
jgi:hypothetical protein